MISAPETETRVRFVVQLRVAGESEWIADTHYESEQDARKAFTRMSRSLPGIYVRLVRETSVITREVLP